MYQASEEFMKYIGESKIRKPKSKIVVDGVEYTGATHLKSFPKIQHSAEKLCGVFPMKTVEFEIYDTDKSLNLYGKEFSVFRGLDIDGDTQWVPMGFFRGENENIKSNITAGTISCKAYDRAHAFDIAFNPLNHSFPCTLGSFANQLCINHGFTLETPEFPLHDLMLNEMPHFSEKITEREIISLIAELSGSIAQISRTGGLVISQPVATGAEIVSGTYKSFSNEKTVAVTTVCMSCEGSEDVIFTDSELVGTYGEFVHHIKDNPFVFNRSEELIEEIASNVIGLNVTPFTLTDYIDDFIYDLNDRVTVKDKSGVVTTTTVLSLSTQSRIKSNFSAPSQSIENESCLPGSVEQKIADCEKKANSYAELLDTSQKSLIEKMNNAFGLFTTELTSADGSRIMYFHDKQMLETSTYIFTFNAEGFAWVKGSGCWNGGSPNWQHGIDADGGAILETLLVRKITADIIEAGTLKSLDGNTYFDLEKAEIASQRSSENEDGSRVDEKTVFSLGGVSMVTKKDGKTVSTLDVTGSNILIANAEYEAVDKPEKEDGESEEEYRKRILIWIGQLLVSNAGRGSVNVSGYDAYNSIIKALVKPSGVYAVNLGGRKASQYLSDRADIDGIVTAEKFNATQESEIPLGEGSRISGDVVIRFSDGDTIYEVTFKELLLGLSESLRDSGYVNLSENEIGSEFKFYTDSTTGKKTGYVRYRKSKGTVTAEGVISPKVDISGSNSVHTIFTLPEGMRPDKAVYSLCQGSGACLWLLNITADGNVGFSRYRDEGGFKTATTSTWLPFNVSFIV